MTRHLALIAAFLIAGCSGSVGAQSTLAPTRDIERPEALGEDNLHLPMPNRSTACLTSPCIYVVSPNFGARQNDDKVAMYPANASGDYAPVHRIKGSRTDMLVPSGVAIDAERNVYVLNSRNTEA